MSSASCGVVMVSVAELGEALGEGLTGFCISCGCSQHGIEPDAARYRCGYCERLDVYGAEQLLITGRLRVVKEQRGGGDGGR